MMFDGVIENVKFWDKRLSQFEMMAIYIHGDIPDYMNVYEMRNIRKMIGEK